MKHSIFKRLPMIWIALLTIHTVYADVAPNPITANGVRTTDSCSIQMISEYVCADLYNDSAKVECSFELVNLGDSVTIQIGFPEMHAQYFPSDYYKDRPDYSISVNGRILTAKDLRMSKELEKLYMADIKQDKLKSEIKKQIKEGNFPWYVWNEHFDKNETKHIKVVYSLPAGATKYYRYFKYILETGSGWHGCIEQADIELKLHGISLRRLKDISPAGYRVNKIKKTIRWNFTHLEPTKKDDINVQYANPVIRNDKYEKLAKRPNSRVSYKTVYDHFASRIDTFPYKKDFLSYQNYLKEQYGISIAPVDQYKDLKRYYILWATKDTPPQKYSHYSVNDWLGPVCQSKDKNCMLMFSADPFAHTNPRNTIEEEISNQIGVIYETMHCDYNDCLTLISGEKAQELFNADSVYVYDLPKGSAVKIWDIPLDRIRRNKYPYCSGIYIYKKNRAVMGAKLFFTEEGKKKQNEYIEALSHSIWYDEASK